MSAFLFASSDNVSNIKLISYYEESPINYRFYFTLYKNGKVNITIKYIHKNNYIYNGKFCKEEIEKVFNLVSKIDFSKINNLEPIAKGSKFLRLEVLYKKKLKVIHISLKNMSKFDGLFLFRQKIKKLKDDIL